MLEMPSGTGKTVSLLSLIVAYHKAGSNRVTDVLKVMTLVLDRSTHQLVPS